MTKMILSFRNCYSRSFGVATLLTKSNANSNIQNVSKHLPSLNFSVEEGIPGLWSPKTTVILTQLLDTYYKKLNQMIVGTDLMGRPVLSIIERCVREKNSPQHQKILQQAGLYWNTEFFLRGLHYNPSLSVTNSDTEQIYSNQVPKGLERVLENEFQPLVTSNSFKKYAFMNRMKDLVLAEAESLFGSGWVWLVRINNNDSSSTSKILSSNSASHSNIKLGILSTINGWTPMSLLMATSSPSSSVGNGNRPSISQMLFGSSNFLDTSSTPFGYYSPVFGISLFENSYLLEFGLDKRAYIDALWKYINWNRIAILLNIQ
jgi:superoxide dismutase